MGATVTAIDKPGAHSTDNSAGDVGPWSSTLRDWDPEWADAVGTMTALFELHARSVYDSAVRLIRQKADW
jgi:hypothetical protein